MTGDKILQKMTTEGSVTNRGCQEKPRVVTETLCLALFSEAKPEISLICDFGRMQKHTVSRR